MRTERVSEDGEFHAVAALLRHLCRDDLPGLSPDSALRDLPGMDSMRLLETAALLEDQYGVELDLGALARLARVRDLVGAVASARAGQASSTALP
jgi:acyl carrier protein